MFHFSHQKLADRHPRELSRFRRWLLGQSAGEAAAVCIDHAEDNACCQREAWAETLATIVAAIRPPHGGVWVRLPDAYEEESYE
jgi:hypothetical protein